MFAHEISVTPTQIALVKATLPRLTKRPAQSAMAFEMHLSRYAPMSGSGMQVAPVKMLSDAIAVIDTPNALHATLTSLAHNLRADGMSPRGYMAVHAALMDMVTEHLGGSVELEDAWAEVIGMILSTMIAEAYGPRSHAMPLAA